MRERDRPAISSKAGYNIAMKELACKPLLLAFLLSLPLWIVFSNYVVALIVALLAAFLISMCYSLYAIKRARQADERGALSSKTDRGE